MSYWVRFSKAKASWFAAIRGWRFGLFRAWRAKARHGTY